MHSTGTSATRHKLTVREALAHATAFLAAVQGLLSGAAASDRGA